MRDRVAFSLGGMVYNPLQPDRTADEAWMRLALEEAHKAGARGEVPVGAVLLDSSGELVARDGNRSVAANDPTGHAEVVVLRQAGARCANYRLPGSTVYVTLEPCAMCAAAMVHARVGRLVFGATDPKAGGVVSLYTIAGDSRLNHRIGVEGGVLAAECATLLREFFRNKRG